MFWGDGRRKRASQSFDLKSRNLNASLVEPDRPVGYEHVARLLSIKGNKFDAALRFGE